MPEVVEVTPETPEVVEEAPEQSYSYQPTDDAGRPMGGKQVIKYRTQEELIAKMQEQNTLLIRKLRQETRKNRLGISEQDEIPAESPRFRAPILLKSQDLSPDQRVKLSRDILDPERFSEANDALFEAQNGVTPEIFRQTFNEMQEEVLRFKVKQETDAFLALNPKYYKCQENFEAITNWMVKNDLAPVRGNFQAAYDELNKAGVLVEAPQPPEVPSPPPPAPALEQPEAKPVARIPSGLTRNQATDTTTIRPVGDDIVYEIVTKGLPNKVLRGMAAVNAMPSDEYKRRLITDPSFSKKIEKLEQQQASLRTQRGLQ